MNTYSISTWMLRDIPWQRAIDMLVGSGFDRVELSGSGSSLLAEWERDCVSTVRRFVSAGIKVLSVHCTKEERHALSSPDEDARRACIEANIRCLERMNKCGISEFVLHTFNEGVAVPGDVIDPSPIWKDSIQRLADRAGDLDVRIAVENAQKSSSRSSTIKNIIGLVNGLGDHVGLCHDVGHSALAGQNPAEEAQVALTSGMLLSLHLHDVDSMGHDHLIPGEGQLDFDALLDELDSAGFPGQRTIEIKPSPGDIARQLEQAAAVCVSWSNPNTGLS